MVDEWLVKAMAAYNADSLENRDGYRGLVHMPGECLEQIVLWSLESLPDEILVGLDVDQKRPHIAEVDEMYQGVEHETDMFAGEGFVLTDATIVNRGDSFSVHHVPEEWTDGIFTKTRDPEVAGSFTGSTPIQTPWQFLQSRTRMLRSTRSEST